MFRRTKSAEAPAPETAKLGGKGRPTPTRREAEAAARVRAKGAQDKKALRERRTEQNAKMRQGMKSGEERYLPARDQGKVRRFIRDMIDARLCLAEFLLPMLVVIMVSQAIGYANIANDLWGALILLVGVDTALVVMKLKRELKRRFPNEGTKGAAFYAVLRSLQLRFLRLPKPQVKLGQKPPERY